MPLLKSITVTVTHFNVGHWRVILPAKGSGNTKEVFPTSEKLSDRESLFHFGTLGFSGWRLHTYLQTLKRGENVPARSVFFPHNTLYNTPFKYFRVGKRKCADRVVNGSAAHPIKGFREKKLVSKLPFHWRQAGNTRSQRVAWGGASVRSFRTNPACV